MQVLQTLQLVLSSCGNGDRVVELPLGRLDDAPNVAQTFQAAFSCCNGPVGTRSVQRWRVGST
jgi:hypothetical protein